MTQKNFNAKKMLMSTTDIFTSILNFFMRAK